MPTLITIQLYTIEEARQRLAEIKARPGPYSRQAFYNAIRHFREARGSQQSKLWWTEDELQQVASLMRRPGRPAT